MDMAVNEEMNSLSPGNGSFSTSRKLPPISTGDDHGILELNNDAINCSSIDHTLTKFEQNAKALEVSHDSTGSVAYISETLIKQMTKDEKLDMITSLTIHFPKDQLNKKIKYIENLEKLKRLQILNLSNNMIEKMQKLETLTDLRELNLSHNCIKIIECLDNMAKLEVLHLSGNQITSIPRSMKKLRSLKVLKLAHNKLESLLEITKLRPLQDLTNLDLQGNPISSLPHYRQFIIYQLPSLDVLDNQTVTKEERCQADMRFSQEEVKRLEVELAKLEKLHQALKDEKTKANETIEQLMKTQISMKEKERRQAERMKELEQDIEAKNTLVKAKNADLIKASEKQYRLEQELAFYKLDAKFDMLGQMPLLGDEQVDEEDGVDDSTYIGKATFKRNQFIRSSNISGRPEQAAQMKSLRRNNEEIIKMETDLDQMLNEKKEHLRQLQRQLDEKNDQLQDVSEKLTLVELSLADQMASLGKGNDLARKQLAEKIKFIKRLQAAAEELETRMKVVANDVAEKQKELEKLGREKETLDQSDDDPQLEQVIKSKEVELQDAYDKLLQMKEDLELLNQRIAMEEAEVERLRRELEEDPRISQEAMEQLKKELECVIQALNKRLEELQDLAKEQQVTIEHLEQEGDDLRAELGEGKDAQEKLEEMEQKLEYALVALKNEERKSQEAEARENELQDKLLAFEKNNKLGFMEADGKLKQASKEIGRLEDNIKKLKAQLENEREAERSRVERDQERIARALQAAKQMGEKEEEIKELSLQVNALKATNEALKDRLDEADQELKKRTRDEEGNDKLLQKLKDLLSDIEQGNVDVRKPVDETDSAGECLAELHQKYLDLLNDREKEREKGKRQEKQARAAVDGLKAKLSHVQSQLKAAENALAQLSEDAARKENELNELEDEIERLRNRLQQPSEKYQDEVDHVRAMAKKQKNRLEEEIKELQAELKELQDKHFDELRKKDEEITELEAILSENARDATDEKEKKKLRRDLDGLKRLLSERAKADKNEQEKKMDRAQRMMDENRRKIEAELRNAENKVQSVENLLKNKQREGTVVEITPTYARHHIHSPRSHGGHTYHHYPGTSFLVARHTKDSPTSHAQRVAEVTTMNEVHHHYGNNTPIQSPAHVNTSHVHADVIRHHHYDNAVLQTPVEVPTATSTNQVHRHYHYGNGDFTMQLKKKRARKKDYCNISEHEDLENDVVALEGKLSSAKSKLSSQMTENKLNALRSDLQNLEHTVSDSFRQKTFGVESHLDETLAKLQDHMLTLMDHRANLSSEHK